MLQMQIFLAVSPQKGQGSLKFCSKNLKMLYLSEVVYEIEKRKCISVRRQSAK